MNIDEAHHKTRRLTMNAVTVATVDSSVETTGTPEHKLSLLVHQVAPLPATTGTTPLSSRAALTATRTAHLAAARVEDAATQAQAMDSGEMASTFLARPILVSSVSCSVKRSFRAIPPTLVASTSKSTTTSRWRRQDKACRSPSPPSRTHRWTII